MKNINKTINYVNRSGTWHAGKVVDYDKDIGLTIVSTTDNNHYLLCLIGPSSSLWKDWWSNGAKGRYLLTFERRIQEIEMGLVDLRVHSVGKSNSPASANTCAFGQ